MSTQSNIYKIIGIVLCIVIMIQCIPNIFYYYKVYTSGSFGSTIEGMATALFYINIVMIIIAAAILVYLLFSSQKKDLPVEETVAPQQGMSYEEQQYMETRQEMTIPKDIDSYSAIEGSSEISRILASESYN